MVRPRGGDITWFPRGQREWARSRRGIILPSGNLASRHGTRGGNERRRGWKRQREANAQTRIIGLFTAFACEIIYSFDSRIGLAANAPLNGCAWTPEETIGAARDMFPSWILLTTFSVRSRELVRCQRTLKREKNLRPIIPGKVPRLLSFSLFFLLFLLCETFSHQYLAYIASTISVKLRPVTRCGN